MRILGLPGISDLIGLLGGYTWPLIVGIIIVLLIYRDNRKRKVGNKKVADGYTDVAEFVKQPTTKPPKVKNPYAGINAMLLAGSALLVVAAIMFTNSANDKLVAPVSIALTLAFYALGIFIYKKFDYLKIVGIAFTYISLATFPFWVIPFQFFGMSWHCAWIWASIISFAVFILTAYIYKSKIPVYFAYIWLFIIAWSCTPEWSVPESGINLPVYWLYISSAVVAMIPAILWRAKPQWLPMYFRKPTKEFAAGFMPAVATFSVWLFAVPNTLLYIPFLRTIMVCFLVAWITLYWAMSHSYNLFVGIRFLAQALLLTVTMDALNFSLMTSKLSGLSEKSQLGIITVWLVSFLAQTMLSLFLPKKTKEVEKAERVAEVCSLIGIFTTPLLTYSLVDPVGATVRLIVCLVIAILGISYAAVHKDMRWTVATVMALFIARLSIAGSMVSNSWNAWIDLLYFTAIGGVIVLVYYFFRKYNEKNAFSLMITEFVICAITIIASAHSADYTELGWLIVSLYLALIGFMSNKAILYEFSVISGAFCLYSLAGTVGEFVLPESAQKCITGPLSFMKPCRGAAASSYTNWIAGINVVRSFIIGGAFTILGIIKERKLEQNKRVRFFLGYVVMSIGLYAVGITAGGHWMAFCLAVQVAYLIYAAMNDIEWLIWVTIIAMPICALSLTGGFTYIWFGILGLTLIGVVIWRLSKINQARLRAQAASQHAPAEKKPEA